MLKYFFFLLTKVVPDFRVPDDGPEKVLRYLDPGRRDDGPQAGEELHLPDHSGDPVLSPASRSTSRSEASELADRQKRRNQDCRLRLGSCLRNSCQSLHPRSTLRVYTF
jgi:hypothetical protein